MDLELSEPFYRQDAVARAIREFAHLLDATLARDAGRITLALSVHVGHEQPYEVVGEFLNHALHLSIRDREQGQP